MHCRVDQVFSTASGLVPIGTKTIALGKSARVSPNHIVQLSVQAAFLAALAAGQRPPQPRRHRAYARGYALAAYIDL